MVPDIAVADVNVPAFHVCNMPSANATWLLEAIPAYIVSPLNVEESVDPATMNAGMAPVHDTKPAPSCCPVDRPARVAAAISLRSKVASSAAPCGPTPGMAGPADQKLGSPDQPTIKSTGKRGPVRGGRSGRAQR
jgi:hypothetical protein